MRVEGGRGIVGPKRARHDIADRLPASGLVLARPARDDGLGEVFRRAGAESPHLQIGARGEVDVTVAVPARGVGDQPRSCGGQHTGARLHPREPAVAGLHRREQRRAPALDGGGRGHDASRRRATLFRRGRHRSRRMASSKRAAMASRACGFSWRKKAVDASHRRASRRTEHRIAGRDAPAASRRRRTGPRRCG